MAVSEPERLQFEAAGGSGHETEEDNPIHPRTPEGFTKVTDRKYPFTQENLPNQQPKGAEDVENAP